MWERLHQMLVKEFIQIFRDPRMRGVIFVAPLIQLILLSYAITTDVRNITTAVLDFDQSPASRELLARFAGSGYFLITARPSDAKEMEELLDRGRVQAAIRMDPGFGSLVLQQRPAPVQLILDGSDSNTAAIIMQYAARIVRDHSAALQSERIRRTGQSSRSPGGIILQSRAWFNENLESRQFFVPGTIAILVTMISLMLTGMAVVREKEIGTMEQIMVTPIRPAEFILGKTLPFALISLLDVVLVTVTGVLWFEVPIRGSLALLLLATVFYLLTTLGAGLLISTLSSTQQQAMLSTFFFFIPAMLLSGFFFPVENMPVVIQWLTLLNPLRFFLVIIRGIFLKGTGLTVLWPEMLILLTMGLAVLGLAVRRFRKTLM